MQSSEAVGNEETLLKDMDGDGKPELIHSGANTLRYSRPDPANPTGTWVTTTISEPGPWGANIGHGMGIGDINGDGLNDYVDSYGWWEQPAKGTAPGTLWKWNPAAFGRWGASQGGAGGAEMGIYDVNGDKLNDVVTALEGHGFGLAWHEQKRDAAGKITFVQHTIMDSALDKNAGDVWWTQPHAVTFADINQDGILDMVTGKRHHSHFQYADPDNWGNPVVYVYKVVRNPKAPGGAEFVPELVNNRAGVGSHIGIGDLNKDGTPDIVTLERERDVHLLQLDEEGRPLASLKEVCGRARLLAGLVRGGSSHDKASSVFGREAARRHRRPVRGVRADLRKSLVSLRVRRAWQ